MTTKLLFPLTLYYILFPYHRVYIFSLFLRFLVLCLKHISFCIEKREYSLDCWSSIRILAFICHHISAWLELHILLILLLLFWLFGAKIKERVGSRKLTTGNCCCQRCCYCCCCLDVVVNLCQLKIICHGYQQQLRKQRMAKVEWGIGLTVRWGGKGEGK